MIKCKKAHVQTNGTVNTLLCELAIITHALKFSGLSSITDAETADKLIRNAVETGLKTAAQMVAEHAGEDA